MQAAGKHSMSCHFLVGIPVTAAAAAASAWCKNKKKLLSLSKKHLSYISSAKTCAQFKKETSAKPLKKLLHWSFSFLETLNAKEIVLETSEYKIFSYIKNDNMDTKCVCMI